MRLMQFAWLPKINGRMVAIAAVILLLAIAIAPQARAALAGSGDPFELWFDEYGNGLVSVNGGAIQPLPGVLAPDPTNGGLPSLTFFLPELVNIGDVPILEAFTSQLSDGLRFTNGNGDLFSQVGAALTADRLIFYSDYDPNEPPEPGVLADTGFPLNFGGVNQNGGPLTEVGPEGNNGVDWFPGGNVYHAVSDGQIVPEPGSIVVWSLLALTFGGATWWRRRKHAA